MRSRSRRRSSRRRASARARSVSCSNSSRLTMIAIAIASPVAETNTSIGMPRVSSTTWSFRTEARGNGASIGTSPPTTAKTMNASAARFEGDGHAATRHRRELASRATQRDGHEQRRRKRDQVAGDGVSDREGRSDVRQGVADLRRRQPRTDLRNEALGDGGRKDEGRHHPHHEAGGRHEAQQRLAAERRDRAVRVARGEPQLDAELEEEREAQRLHQQLKDEERLDGRCGQPAGLDRDEQVAPDHQAVQQPEGGEPAERARERQLGSAPALEGDGEAHDEEDLPVDRQDDDAVGLEQLGQPGHGRNGRARRARIGG